MASLSASALPYGTVRNSRFSLIIVLLLLLGLYFPTTVSQQVTPLFAANYLVNMVLLCVLILGRPHRPSVPVCLLLLTIVPLLLVFTFTSGVSTLRLGALPPYLLASMMFLTDLRDIRMPEWSTRLWLIVNCVNVVAGIAIVLGNQTVDNFIIAHYSAGYDTLVSNMLMWRKPVLTFGTHSVAAFFLYVFFWINLQAYKARRQWWLLMLAISYLILTAFLLSVSAVAFAFTGLIQIFFFVWSSLRRKFLWAVIFVVLLLLVVLVWGSALAQSGADKVVLDIVQNPGSGYLGRFLPGGSMYYDLQYIAEHPFSPVGASFKDDMVAGDGGIVEYLLRGSLPLLLLMYGGLLYFLRRNLQSHSQAYFFFGIIVAFEIGMTTLANNRALFLYPAMVVYLNHLTAPRENTLAAQAG